jgi:hypothetical protein
VSDAVCERVTKTTWSGGKFGKGLPHQTCVLNLWIEKISQIGYPGLIYQCCIYGMTSAVPAKIFVAGPPL